MTLRPDVYLANADRLMATDPVRGTRGLWPRASAWLLRLALETALDQFWQSRSPAVGACHNRRAQILMLKRFAAPATARKVGYLWWALSRAGHHHGYELALTAGELRHLFDEVTLTVATLTRTDRMT